MLKFFDKYQITDNTIIITWCSWWSDSMYLLYEIKKIHPNNNIIVAHFNHNLRWKESKRDEDFVRKYCQDNNLIFITKSSDVSKYSKDSKIWIEEWARKLRYEFFEDLQKKCDKSIIFTAHHLDDSIETFMFNLIRWSKLWWLTWIEEINWNIYRPLLNISKKEILQNCLENNITFIEDSTNKDDKYQRNHIRLNILTEFEKINPNYRKAIFNTMKYFKELKDFSDKNNKKLIKDDNKISIEEFEKLDTFEKKELIAYMYKIRNFWTIWLTEKNINEILKFINDRWNATIKEIKKLKIFKKNWFLYF